MSSARAHVESSIQADRINLLDLDRSGMEAFFAAHGEKAFRAKQLVQWMHQRLVVDFDAMSNLAKPLRAWLAAHTEIRLPSIAREQLSRDGTVKWLLRFEDGNGIETVFIPEDDRGTLCISSQVGCSLNCTFCSTARQGYNRNLTTGEIISQVFIAQRALVARGLGERPITNIVFMGMGEPLLNYEEVVRAIRLLLDDYAYGLSKRRVTVSTAGIVPALDRLREECPVSLAVSLHAPNDALRDELVPLNRKYPLVELLAACRRYVDRQPRRRVTFEYVMLAGINDGLAEARALTRLLRDVPSKVNLIPFNPFPDTHYQTSDWAAIDGFRDVLMAAGIMTVTRKTRGDDIDAACGQLAGKVNDRTRRSERLRAQVENLAGVFVTRWLIVVLSAVLAACSSQPTQQSSNNGGTPAQINAKLGLSYMQQGNYDIALEKLKRSLEQDPKLPSAHHYIAELYKTIKNYDLADEHYRTAISLTPDDPALLNNYGVFLCGREHYSAAEEHFVKAARIKGYQRPDEAYENAALCALRIPDKVKARNYFRAALEANPLLAPALLQMSALSAEAGEYLQARAFLQRYEAVAPHTPQSLWLGVSIEHELRNATAASDYARQLREQFPRAEETARLRELE